MAKITVCVGIFLMKVDNFVAPLTENNTTLKANSFMQWERWIEKGDFRSKTKSCILTQSKKCLFDPDFFDRAIRSAHPVEKVDLFNGMHGSDCSIEKVFESHRISHHPGKHTITPYKTAPRCWLDCYCCCSCCSQRVSVANAVLCPPAARTGIRSKQCVLSMILL